MISDALNQFSILLSYDVLEDSTINISFNGEFQNAFLSVVNSTVSAGSGDEVLFFDAVPFGWGSNSAAGILVTIRSLETNAVLSRYRYSFVIEDG